MDAPRQNPPSTTEPHVPSSPAPLAAASTPSTPPSGASGRSSLGRGLGELIAANPTRSLPTPLADPAKKLDKGFATILTGNRKETSQQPTLPEQSGPAPSEPSRKAPASPAQRYPAPPPPPPSAPLPHWIGPAVLGGADVLLLLMAGMIGFGGGTPPSTATTAFAALLVCLGCTAGISAARLALKNPSQKNRPGAPGNSKHPGLSGPLPVVKRS